MTIPRVKIPDETLFGLDPAVLLFAMGITLLTTVACGLVPALHSVRSTLQTKLVGSGKGSTGDFRHGTLRSSLVVAEVAFSIVLLTGAGLTIQNLLALTRTRLGFDPNALLSVQFDAPASYSNQQRNAFLAQLLGRVKILPGVDAASVIHSGPPLWAVPSEISIPGRSHVERWESLVDEGGEDYCAALGLGLVAGRVLSQDDVASARAVAVVNQAFASKYFGTVSPIDRVVRFNAFDSLPQAPHSFEIVGVVTDYKNRGVIEPALPEAILPYTVDVSDISTIMVRSTVKTGAFIKAVDQASAVIDPNIAVSVAPMNAFLQDNVYEEPQFDFMGFGAFAGIGLLLVTTGVFSVMAYTVSLRTHEIGVRIALGAQPRDILRLVLNKGVRLMAAGSMLGLFGSHTIIRFAASEISGLSGATGWISCAVLVLVVGVGLFACFWPARKATRVDPLMALRYE